MVKQILLKTKADELTVLELNKILQKKKFMILTQMIYFLINVVLNVALKN
ncbi:unknown [Prevotella sp. CAG:1031]|nr:unknown [Prevotella sp. CAG:1031]